MAASQSTVLCEPCGHSGTTQSAEKWCNDCGEGFCAECMKGHQVTKLLRGHHVISVEDYHNISGLKIEDTCKKHQRSYDFFCKQHDVVLCLQCFQSDHHKCDIVKLDEVATGSKTSTALLELENEVSSILENLKKGIETEDMNAKDLEKCDKMIRQKITDKHIELKTILDRLQENVLKELSDEYHTCKEELDSFKRQIGESLQIYHEFQEKIHSLKHFTSDKQAFMGIRKLCVDIKQNQEGISQFCKNQHQYKIQLDISDDTSSSLETGKLFGQIVVNSQIVQTGFFTRPILKAQDMVVKPSFASIRLERTSSLHMKDTSKLSLTGCALLPNGNMVFVDNNNDNLILYTHDGIHITDIKIGVRPFDIAALSNGSVSITFFNKQYVDIINLHSKVIERRILAKCCKGSYWGLSFRNENINVLSCASNIVISDVHGQISKRIPFTTESVFNIAVYQDRIVYSNVSSHYVSAIDYTGKVLWTMEDDRINSSKRFINNYSLSLTVDNHGNVFVTLPNADCVLLISSDGENKRVILDRSHGIEEPSGISFLSESNKLLVCSISGKAWVFQLTYRH